MMLQRSSPDDGGAAAVARLTAKERECLDRWLGHATAKEIALELGITHHAVEKRLKSARAKLGVTSTLDAARLLAAAEGYGPTVSQSPEVGAANEPGEDQRSAAAEPIRPDRRATIILSGALIMSLVILAALAFTAQPAAAPPAERKVMVVNRKDGTERSVDLAQALGGAFASMDNEGDKIIAGSELANSQFQVIRTVIRTGETTPAPAKTTLTDFDKDGDKRVSEAEFLAGMNGLTQRPR